MHTIYNITGSMSTGENAIERTIDSSAVEYGVDTDQQGYAISVPEESGDWHTHGADPLGRGERCGPGRCGRAPEGPPRPRRNVVRSNWP